MADTELLNNNIDMSIDNIPKLKKEPNPNYKKDIRLKKERDETLSKIKTILNITESNKTFFSHEIYEETQNKILALKDEVARNFKTSSWATYRKGSENVSKPYLSLIRCVFRDMKVNYSCSTCKIKNENGEYISTTLYKLD